MPLFEYPSSTEVQAEAKLRPEQAGVAPSGYYLDVVDRIDEEAALIEDKLLARYGPAKVTTLTDNQLTTAKKWLELRACASLYHSAGQLNDKYKAQALDYERRATEREVALLASLDGFQVREEEVRESRPLCGVQLTRAD